MPREDGQRSKASFIISRDRPSMAFFSYFLMLRLVRKISIMVYLQKKIEGTPSANKILRTLILFAMA
jgi:hypothetical protein